MNSKLGHLYSLKVVTVTSEPSWVTVLAVVFVILKTQASLGPQASNNIDFWQLDFILLRFDKNAKIR